MVSCAVFGTRRLVYVYISRQILFGRQWYAGVRWRLLFPLWSVATRHRDTLTACNSVGKRGDGARELADLSRLCQQACRDIYGGTRKHMYVWFALGPFCRRQMIFNLRQEEPCGLAIIVRLSRRIRRRSVLIVGEPSKYAVKPIIAIFAFFFRGSINHSPQSVWTKARYAAPRATVGFSSKRQASPPSPPPPPLSRREYFSKIYALGITMALGTSTDQPNRCEEKIGLQNEMFAVVRTDLGATDHRRSRRGKTPTGK